MHNRSTKELNKMRKKVWLIIAVVVVLVALSVAIASVCRFVPPDEMQDTFDRLEAALGEEWKKQTVVEVSDFVYSDGKGNTIIYYICVTTYYEADANNQTGLHTDAISAVIVSDEAEECRECTVNDFPAAIYQKDGRAYLCWTITPELSCVIEYDPAVESEEDMLRIAESVPVNAGRSVEPSHAPHQQRIP